MASNITQHDDAFPASCKELHDAPQALYTRGSQSVLDHPRRCGIVGSRKMTGYGKRFLHHLIPVLVRHDIAIVSGLAFGVDAYAHELTLEHSGIPICVLGSGIENITPKANEGLGKNIERCGCIVSEYEGTASATKYSFPARNRIIAALSHALVVIEGTKRSGSLITADFMLQLGKDVFALPGNIDSPLSAGPNFLLEHGAHVLTSADSILDYFGVDKQRDNFVSSGVSDQHRSVLELLMKKRSTFDEICSACTLLPSTANALLTELEMKGLCARSVDGTYTLINT